MKLPVKSARGSGVCASGDERVTEAGSDLNAIELCAPFFLQFENAINVLFGYNVVQ